MISRPSPIVARPIVSDDIPWLCRLGQRRYPDWQVSYEWAAAFLATWMLDPMALAWRTGRAAIACKIVVWAFAPAEPHATMIFLAAEKGGHWEAAHLLEIAACWAEGAGASRFSFGAETDADFAVYAKWLRKRGHKVYQDKPTFSVRF